MSQRIDRCIVIPARYGSRRLPGKVLLDLGGKPIVQHVIERALEVVDKDDVLLATDHEAIARVGEPFGIRIVMTDRAIPNGTLRCIRALESVEIEPQYVINLQADEPFVLPGDLERLFLQLERGDEIVTLAMEPTYVEDYHSAHHVKVVCDKSGRAMYFSRAPIPWGITEDALAEVRIHIGIYGFRYTVMKSLSLGATPSLAQREQLEQLSWLWVGKTIRVLDTSGLYIGIDTQKDYERALEMLNARGSKD